MDIQNEYLPADRQDIDDIPLPEDEQYHQRFSHNNKVRLDTPCIEHKIAFPSSNKRFYPELKNIPVYCCDRCGWFCYEGRENESI